MDTENEKAFLVHLPHKIIKFRLLSNNLYGMDPTNPESNIMKDKVTNEKIQMLNLVEDNLNHMLER